MKCKSEGCTELAVEPYGKCENHLNYLEKKDKIAMEMIVNLSKRPRTNKAILIEDCDSISVTTKRGGE